MVPVDTTTSELDVKTPENEIPLIVKTPLPALKFPVTARFVATDASPATLNQPALTHSTAPEGPTHCSIAGDDSKTGAGIWLRSDLMIFQDNPRMFGNLKNRTRCAVNPMNQQGRQCV